MLPNVGDCVEIECVNPAYERRHVYENSWSINPTETFVGTVMAKQKWQKDDVINLSADFGKSGFRQIYVSRILKIQNGQSTTKMEPKPINQQTRTWTVEGSKGHKYTVTESNGHRRCTCVGFDFRKTCKHIKMDFANV
jgi:hypothetical protein